MVILRELWEKFERILRELRENLASREKLEKWKCDENRLPEKTGKMKLWRKRSWQDL
jgi:hypothetical protein